MLPKNECWISFPIITAAWKQKIETVNIWKAVTKLAENIVIRVCTVLGWLEIEPGVIIEMLFEMRHDNKT